jgi:hypothetical protein
MLFRRLYKNAVICAATIIYIAAATRVSLADDLPFGVTCEKIRTLVAEHGKAKALAWAVREGYSWRAIQEARKCLR